ncbi:MAG: hypothetical protein WAN18_28320 [Candidatus Sulfotelmatobacter sp.]
MRLVIAFQFGADDPQVIHIFAAHGSKSGNDRAGGTVGLAGSPSRMRAGHGFCEIDPVVVAPVVTSIVPDLSYLPYVSAFANSFIDGGAGSSTQSDESAATVAVSIKNGTATRAACSLRHPKLVSEVSIRSQASTIEPCLVEEFAGLHVKAYRHETGLTERVRRRPSA